MTSSPPDAWLYSACTELTHEKLAHALALATSPSLVAQPVVTADSWPGSRPAGLRLVIRRESLRTRPPQLSTWSGKSQGTVGGGEQRRQPRRSCGAGAGQHSGASRMSPKTEACGDASTRGRLGYEHALGDLRRARRRRRRRRSRGTAAGRRNRHLGRPYRQRPPLAAGCQPSASTKGQRRW